MTNESLGQKILEKLYKLTEEEMEQGSEDSEAEGENTQETSETLKKLRGHLLRFQEEAGAKTYAAGGALAGAAAGSALAKRSAKKAYNLGGMTKDITRQGVEAGKNVSHFTNKAVAKSAMANAQKAMGNKVAAGKLAKGAQASANAAYKSAQTAKNVGKGLKALNKPIKAAGRAGGLKGALIGGTAAYLGKKAYDHFKK